MAMTIVALKIIFSTPRLVEYTPPSPPKAPDKPEPRCCNSMVIIRRAAKTICTIVIVMQICPRIEALSLAVRGQLFI